MSIDGFIARTDGSLDWLDEFENQDGEDYGYNKFIAGIDTIVMGRVTYEQILGFGIDWPYSGYRTFVLTTDANYNIMTPDTEITDRINKNIIDNLKSAGEKDIWIAGGGKLITEFLNLGAIDEMILSVVPRILGSGIRLIPGNPGDIRFELLETETFKSGIVNLNYKRVD